MSELDGVTLTRGNSQPGTLEALIVVAEGAHLGVGISTSRQENPIYVDRDDFHNAACAYGHRSRSAFGRNAWKGIVRVLFDAHNADQKTPLIFDEYPPSKEWDILRDIESVGPLEVGSLAVFTQTIESQVNLRDNRVDGVDNQISALLPNGVGVSQFRFWKTFAKQTLAGEHFPRVL